MQKINIIAKISVATPKLHKEYLNAVSTPVLLWINIEQFDWEWACILHYDHTVHFRADLSLWLS